MPLLLPNLDDRRWAELVDEGRALIPVYGPEWTDHNAHDPGITLMELSAWITEMDIYQLNQVSDADRRKFLKLVGVATRPPLPARAVLSFAVSSTTPVMLPEGLEVETAPAEQPAIRFRTRHSASLVPGSLDAVQFSDAKGFQNLTPSWLRRRTFYPLGIAPQSGVAFYLGFSKALPVGVETSLYFTFAGGFSGAEERERLLRESRMLARNCQCTSPNNPCQKQKPPESHPPKVSSEDCAPSHYGVRTVWEIFTLVNGQEKWRALDPAKGEVTDGTRAFTLDGPVNFRVSVTMTASKLGSVATPLFYLRCRIAAGMYDAAPLLQDVAFNSVGVIQSVPSFTKFTICPEAEIVYASGSAPKPNELTTLRLELDARGRIKRLTFGGGKTDDPAFRILEYCQPPSAHIEGLLRLQAVFLGVANGMPSQRVRLPDLPVERSEFHLYTLEGDNWRNWEIRPDFYSTSREDFHALLDLSTGEITFGDGERGRVPPALPQIGAAPPETCLIFAVARTTQATAGNLPAKAITELSRSSHNLALLYNSGKLPDGWTQFKAMLASFSNPLPAGGGAAEETVVLASGRADKLISTSERAVTLRDCERLAQKTPGTRVARAKAIANHHPSFPCFDAPGLITVVIVPYLPAGRPVPSPGLVRTVSGYLRHRRILTTRVEVVGPGYVKVAVRATVQSKKGIQKTALQQLVKGALDTFMDPLTGGPDGKGWPFGRDVYRSEILRVMDQVSGVDHILSLDLLAHGCQATCGNVCLDPISLVFAGAHEITVL